PSRSAPSATPHRLASPSIQKPSFIVSGLHALFQCPEGRGGVRAVRRSLLRGREPAVVREPEYQALRTDRPGHPVEGREALGARCRVWTRWLPALSPPNLFRVDPHDVRA